MKIASIKAMRIVLPFRFSFGHSLASRKESENLIVKVVLDNGVEGYGEGIPRSYVTGENIQQSLEIVNKTIAPSLIGLDVSNKDKVVTALWNLIEHLNMPQKRIGATFCAVELAVLDAVAKAHQIAIAEWFGPIKNPVLQYGAVVPFGNKKAMVALLLFYKFWGFKTVKLKVGGSLEDDLSCVKLARTIMGNEAIIRTDANCAWNLDQAKRAQEQFARFDVKSIEQPVKADDYKALAALSACGPAQIVVDESLCTFDDAERLVSEKACNAFNIRISKVGGLLMARKIAAVARQAQLSVHMGAQVGETAILNAAGRIFGATEESLENYEGANNSWLLQHDISRENLTVSLRGLGRIQVAQGLGITILEDKLRSMEQIEHFTTDNIVPAQSLGAEP